METATKNPCWPRQEDASDRAYHSSSGTHIPATPSSYICVIDGEFQHGLLLDDTSKDKVVADVDGHVQKCSQALELRIQRVRKSLLHTKTTAGAY